MPPAHFKDLALDALDHQRLADWWCAALGYERRTAPHGEEWPRDWAVLIVDPDGQGPPIWFNPVSEPRSAKSRMHLDVWGSTEELLQMGANLVRARDEQIPWDVLTDPEGNLFCVFQPRTDKPPVSLGMR